MGKQVPKRTQKLQSAIADLSHVDIDSELRNHTALAEWNTVNNAQKQLEKDIAQLTAQQSRAARDVERTQNALTSLEEGTCDSCGQSVDHLEEHKTHVKRAKEEYQEASDFLAGLQTEIAKS